LIGFGQRAERAAAKAARERRQQHVTPLYMSV